MEIKQSDRFVKVEKRFRKVQRKKNKRWKVD